jgi:DNA-directed RNA polymerase specialized sigma24 family protein
MGGSDALNRLLNLPDPRLPTDESDGVNVAVPYPEDAASGEEDDNILRRRAIDLVLEVCSEQNREAFLRIVGHCESPSDVARDQERSVNSIYLAQSRILKRIREEFQGLIEL